MIRKKRHYAVTTGSGAVVISAFNKLDALKLFKERGYKVRYSDVYLYEFVRKGLR